jgi:hypothetical protein
LKLVFLEGGRMAAGIDDKDGDADIKVNFAKESDLPHESLHSKAIDRAKAATEKEHRMSLLEGIRT